MLLFGQFDFEGAIRPFLYVDICSFIFQSKEIGLQMHEELLKVTNELYTVSSARTIASCLGLFSTHVWREAGKNLE